MSAIANNATATMSLAQVEAIALSEFETTRDGFTGTQAKKDSAKEGRALLKTAKTVDDYINVYTSCYRGTHGNTIKVKGLIERLQATTKMVVDARKAAAAPAPAAAAAAVPAPVPLVNAQMLEAMGAAAFAVLAAQAAAPAPAAAPVQAAAPIVVVQAKVVEVEPEAAPADGGSAPIVVVQAEVVEVEPEAAPADGGSAPAASTARASHDKLVCASLAQVTYMSHKRRLESHDSDNDDDWRGESPDGALWEAPESRAAREQLQRGKQEAHAKVAASRLEQERKQTAARLKKERKQAAKAAKARADTESDSVSEDDKPLKLPKVKASKANASKPVARN